MVCFTEFYKLLEILTQPITTAEDEEQEGIFNGFSSDLSTGIEKTYFDKIDHASSMILSLYEKYIADTQMHIALHQRFNTHRRKDYNDLKLMLMIDVVRAYESLNHSTRLNCPEGIALLLLLVKLFRPDYFISYHGLKEIPSDIINLDGVVPYILACSYEIGIPYNVSVISLLLSKVHPKADRLYRISMYYLFESVSEVDGFISLSEREYLMELLHLDDGDITTDINIDSIFTRETSVGTLKEENHSKIDR